MDGPIRRQHEFSSLGAITDLPGGVGLRGARRRGRGARSGPGRRLRPGHRCDAAGSGPGGLADVAADARRVGLQPAGLDHARERRRSAHGLVARPERRHAGGDAARLRRRAVHAEPVRRHPGHRCRHRRSAVGVPPRPPGRPRRLPLRGRHQPQRRHSRQPDHRQQRRRLRLRARRDDGRAGVGDGGSSTTARSPPTRRPARSSPTAGWSRGAVACRRAVRTPASSRPTTRRLAPSCGAGGSSPAPASPATRHGAACRSSSARTSGRGWCRATMPSWISSTSGPRSPRRPRSSCSAAPATRICTTTRRLPSTAPRARSAGTTST